jgi:hypothetical protein
VKIISYKKQKTEIFKKSNINPYTDVVATQPGLDHAKKTEENCEQSGSIKKQKALLFQSMLPDSNEHGKNNRNSK